MSLRKVYLGIYKFKCVSLLNNQHLNKFCDFQCGTTQSYSSAKYTVKLLPDVEKDIDSGEVKHRKHPGIRRVAPISLPPKLIESAYRVMPSFDTSSILQEAATFCNIISKRRLPIEMDEVHYRMRLMFPQIFESEENISEDEKKELLNQAKKKLQCELRRWKPIDYTVDHHCLVYLIARLALNYACVIKVFSEIKIMVPSFKPETFFDFGSGVGSATWAAHTVFGESIKEYFCVDASAEMNKLCEKLLQDENGEDKILKTVFFRQFLPASDKIKYNLVTSAFSLLELPSAMDRLRTVDTLWRKTSDTLVIIEPGTNAGFSAILDARDYILKMEASESTSSSTPGAHVLCPCPHEFDCPRIKDRGFTPCTNIVSYHPLFPEKVASTVRKTLFSYVVIRRGPKPTDQILWPRNVKPIGKHPKHVVCHLCCSDGKIKDITITKSRHGRNVYRCARKSELGDLLPVTLSILESSQEENTVAESDDESEP